MFLTKFEINAARRQTHELLDSPQRMHAAVLSSFTSAEADADRPLWRVDSGSPHPTLWMVSEHRPDVTHLQEQMGWPTKESWKIADYAPFLRSLREGQVWRFRLVANPTVSVRREPGGPTKRVGHVTATQQEQWLAQRADRLGVVLSDEGANTFSVTSRRIDKFRKTGHRVTLARAQFDGVLRVSDVDLLRSALTAGVGPAKAYGCGLLTLARVQGSAG